MRRDPVEVARDGMEEARDLMVTTDQEDDATGWENVDGNYNEDTIAAALRDLLEPRYVYLHANICSK